MNTLQQVRKQVVVNGKLRYGATSRLAALLGIANRDVPRVILGDPRGRYFQLTADQMRKLENAVDHGVELFAVRTSMMKCDAPGCKSRCHARGKCKKHYFQAWRKSLIAD